MSSSQIALIFVLAGNPLAAAREPAVTGLVAENDAIRVGSHDHAAWRFATSAPGHVRFMIFDARDVLVRTLVDDAAMPTGDHRAAWDGRDDGGRPVPSGYYLVALSTERDGPAEWYDLSDTTGGEFVKATGARYDTVKNAVCYSLPQRSLVRVLVVLKGDGPVMRTVVDGIARERGEHCEPWDGWDYSHVVDVGRTREVEIGVFAYALPSNAVLVESEEASTRPRFIETGVAVESRPHVAKRSTVPFDHWVHPRQSCHDPAIVLHGPANIREDSKGRLPVRGDLPMTLDAANDEKAFLENERFEVVVYLDGLFVFEDEKGYLPFTWPLKSSLVTPGDHFVTFLVRSYGGHFGSASVRVLGPDSGTAAVKKTRPTPVVKERSK